MLILRGTIITSTLNKTLHVLDQGYIIVSDAGIIEEIIANNLPDKYKKIDLLDVSPSLILPGFIDIHNHLPQYALTGLGQETLLLWLQNYVYPREVQFCNMEIAQQAAQHFFNDLLAHGTTTTVTYVTTHKQATDISFQAAEQAGIRAIIGKVMMDRNAPPTLCESIEKALTSTEELIQKWHNKNNRLFYAITPRFALSCTPELLHKCGQLAKQYNTYIQTHISENRDEVAQIKKLFPDQASYLDVYNHAGLLGPKSILAHGIYLSEEEQMDIKKTGTHLAHCPTSNRFLASGIMPARLYAKKELSFGLASDVSGGYSLSMLNEIKECIENSKLKSIFDPTHPSAITLEEAFYWATLGNAKILGLDKSIGSIDIGKEADLIVLDPKQVDPLIFESGYNSPKQLLAKCVYAPSRHLVTHAFVRGFASCRNHNS